MDHRSRIIRNTAGLLILSLILWIVFMLLTSKRIQTGWSRADYLAYVFEGDPLFIVTYINALLLTLLTSFMFVLLYLVFVEHHAVAATMGLIFVPVYAAFNMVAYGSQVFILPILARKCNITELVPAEKLFLSEWIQMVPGTVVSMVNGMGYAILGILSVCFGLVFFNQKPPGRIISILLITNALACFAGIIGMAADIAFMTHGIMFGGFLFAMAIPFMMYFFHNAMPTH